MAWMQELLRRLADLGPCGYEVRQTPAGEPTALAACALLSHGWRSEAQAGLEYLRSLQTEDGAVPVREGETQPGWPVSLALLAWRLSGDDRFAGALQRGADWLLTTRGEVMSQATELGHDTTLAAWPWALGTHSWLEPTAFAVLALKAVGKSDHPRTREAVQMLLDRQFPGGGCNYGNTFVLGQQLRPHVQPTGIALAALAGEQPPAPRLRASIGWLKRTVSPETTPASLAWAIRGLAAHGAAPAAALEWLRAAYERVCRNGGSPYKLALVALAAHQVSDAHELQHQASAR